MSYYVVHSPFNYSLMDIYGKAASPVDIVRYLSRNKGSISQENFMQFLDFDLGLERRPTYPIGDYSSEYIANQIAKQMPDRQIIMSDARRRPLSKIIESKGLPISVFISSNSCTFPAAVATTIALNHGHIPVVLGGIHVSTSKEDMHYILDNVPHPGKVSYVVGAGDSEVIRDILHDLDGGKLKKSYHGSHLMEDGVWGMPNVEWMRPESFYRKGRPISWFGRKYTLNALAPFSGCPYSCRFCSISAIDPKDRRFCSRSPDDVIAELQHRQEGGVQAANRTYYIIADNLVRKDRRWHDVLDRIIESDVRINYGCYISIDIADDDELLKKMRKSGAVHLFIGLESLDIRNLEYIGKNSVAAMRRLGLSPEEYFSRQIRKIQDKGIFVQGAFIFGLPHDYYVSPEKNSAVDVIRFAKKNNIQLQVACLTDLPGSRSFKESQDNRGLLYGEPGTMDYLVSLCACDLHEGNRKIESIGLRNSPLLAMRLAYGAVTEVNTTWRAIWQGIGMVPSAIRNPTKNVRFGLYERWFDIFSALSVPLIPTLDADTLISICRSRDGMKGSMERLYKLETDNQIKNEQHRYMCRFIFDGSKQYKPPLHP